MILSFFASLSLTKASAAATVGIWLSMTITPSFAPPWSGPRSEPMAPVIAE